jgi:type IV pilus assembly protein PilM
MASSDRIFTLNLGTQTIGLAEFHQSSSGGLVLARFKQSEILGDPGADATRNLQTRLQIQELASALGLKGRKVNYAIASHMVFTRPVTLPAVGDASQIEQIVGFEAQQNVPYPIDQVVWDWQVLDQGSAGQVEVILAAIKSDLLDEINASVQGAGLTPQIIEIAPLALYNSLRYNYADATGCTVLVDIGSRTTNLLFCESGKIFPRRLNIGGSTITTAIAKDFGISFAEADLRKVKDGFVSLGGNYAEPDDVEIARISKIIRNQMTRLHQEIARSITFYRSEHGGAQPVRVLLAGGTASLPYVREFFQEKFPSMEVEYFNPLRNVTIASSLDPDEVGRVAHMLGELVGLALRGAGNCPMELNLRPASMVSAERRDALRPFFVVTGFCVLASLLAWWKYYDSAAVAIREVAQTLQAKALPLKTLDTKILEAKESIKALAKSTEPILRVTEERDYWVNVLDDLNKRIPPRFIWITSLETPTKEDPRKDGKEKGAGGPGGKSSAPSFTLTVKGLYLSRDADNKTGPAIVSEFIKRLKESPYVVPIEESDAGYLRAMDNTNDWAFKFVLPLRLKNPIALK